MLYAGVSHGTIAAAAVLVQALQVVFPGVHIGGLPSDEERQAWLLPFLSEIPGP